MQHFKAAGCMKYSLEALKLQIHSRITCSPNLAHQIIWNRFVNVRGGAGNNIPCDLFNEHINKQKCIISNMGSNLTESALQRAARRVTSLHRIPYFIDQTPSSNSRRPRIVASCCKSLSVSDAAIAPHFMATPSKTLVWWSRPLTYSRLVEKMTSKKRSYDAAFKLKGSRQMNRT